MHEFICTDYIYKKIYMTERPIILNKKIKQRKEIKKRQPILALVMQKVNRTTACCAHEPVLRKRRPIHTKPCFVFHA